MQHLYYDIRTTIGLLMTFMALGFISLCFLGICIQYRFIIRLEYYYKVLFLTNYRSHNYIWICLEFSRILQVLLITHCVTNRVTFLRAGKWNLYSKAMWQIQYEGITQHDKTFSHSIFVVSFINCRGQIF